MRISFFLALAISILFSCGKDSDRSTTGSSQLTFTVDTVWVDPGDEIIFLRDNLFLSDLSPDGSYLINFDRANLVAERINLNDLRLEKKIQFEKDGPNALPIYFGGFNIMPNEQLLVWNYRYYKLFDQNTQMVKDLGLEKIAAEFLSGSDCYPIGLFEDQKNENRLIGVFIKWAERSYFILDFDLTAQTFTKTELPELNPLQRFSVEILHDGNFAGAYGVAVRALTTGKQLLVTNNSLNEVLVYDLEADSTFTKAWDSDLLGKGKSYLPPKEVENSSGQIEDIIRKIKEDIVFESFFWDEDQNRFYRFASSEHFSDEKDEYGRYVPTGADVYLSIFDESLNLLAEALIPQLNATPKKHFLKDGKIWIFENIADELAFIRLMVE
ncbi:MAG: DUF4221 family protein [Lunatimonas sp.]|uniref:DUF4221 family protein n=1 Tax=Lunatimonas sp. TaxID=2060141 RepID=UPI00263B7017|nr:DUF4221 family protein [Lunatimonas sp.]MCC5938071.1 DUF4221 family protein [Lunatimonas sp.]